MIFTHAQERKAEAMRRLDRITDTLFSIENSTVDPNKFYSILLDARASAVSENMCDIAEKLLTGEKENARVALDQLQKLKKNLFSNKNPTIDLLITFYKDKLDILQDKEDHLKKVSLDSRSLLEEKRRKDEEVATVKQQVAECTRDLNELSSKLDKLKIREQELLLIEHQLKQELNRNECEIVNGLYEIILTEQDSRSVPALSVQDVPQPEQVTEAPVKQPEMPVVEEISQPEAMVSTSVFEPPIIKDQKDQEDGNTGSETPDVNEPLPEIPVFPKSIVKTASGKIIGEYYYDGKVYKNERHYIFNSRFFAGEIISYVNFLRKKFDLALFTDVLQMVQDAIKRTSENKQLHFEVATNEILNDKTLRRLLQDLKLRSLDEVERFAVRLNAKIDVLGNNYTTMLGEQLQRCSEKS